MEYVKTSLCMAGPHTCFGCCGRDYKKDDIPETILKNTLDLKYKTDLKSFKDRFPKDELRGCGVCANLIYSDEEKSKTTCPLHPMQTPDKSDMREGHCDISFSCKAAFLFEGWNERIRNKFIQFLKEKGDDLTTYSLKMDADEYIEEFMDYLFEK